MPSAKLIKALERRGFYLEFPDYESIEGIIIDTLKENNPRLNLSLPLIIKDDFDYKKLISKLSKAEKKELDKIIFISDKIYRKEKVKSGISKVISENKIKCKFLIQEFKDYYSVFKEASERYSQKSSEIIEKQSKLRLNLDLNKSLEVLFSPAKIRIMKKIFNHEKLTNTEIKYYYKAISSINKAILSPQVLDYLRVIEISRKFV